VSGPPTLVVVGLSHHTAPVEVRERAALAESALPEVLKRAAGQGGEAFIVSTCNRVEVYLATDLSVEQARIAVEALLCDGERIKVGDLSSHLYQHGGEAAVRHLFRVASSLDSMVVGEPQILGQVKSAFDVAMTAGTVGQLLGRAVPRAFATAKRVRTETEVARSSASVASAAVELARHIFGDLDKKEVLVVGAGDMGDGAAKHLTAAGAGPILVCSRTLERAAEVAGRIGGSAHPWTELESLLNRADIVLCSTGAPHPVIRRDMVQRAMKARKGRWLCFIDIAVPRDVEAEVADLANVYLYDVDALRGLVDDHLAGRQKEAQAAEAIVTEEVTRFLAAERSLGVVPTIKALRERFSEVARAEAQKAASSDGERQKMERLAEAIVGKLLHAPLTALKREADSETLIEAARTLFGIEEAPAESSAAPSAEAKARGQK
jgi:glutamyl-tRNA reductase